jgi:hypothetical protein
MRRIAILIAGIAATFMLGTGIAHADPCGCYSGSDGNYHCNC